MMIKKFSSLVRAPEKSSATDSKNTTAPLKAIITHVVQKIVFVIMLSLSIIAASPVLASSELRIISTDAGTTEILIALGQGPSLVGIDVTSVVPDNLSPDKVGYHRNLAAEGMLSLAPTHVFGGAHIGPVETVNALKLANTTLVLQPEAQDPEQLISNIRRVASTLNLSPDGLIEQVEAADISLAQSVGRRARNGELRTVFLLYLEGRGLKQAGMKTSGDALVSLLGLQQLADHTGYRAISPEGLLALQPEVILIGSQNPSAVETLVEQYPVLKHSLAWQQQRVLFVDASALVSGISLNAMEESVRLSHAL